jgi:MFS transporter, ACS family, D-galactonate transporter
LSTGKPIPVAAQSAINGASMTRRRWLMLTLLLLAIVVNYVDRGNLSVAAPGLIAELHLSPVQMGLLFSAFAWTYGISNLPGGYVIDKLGARVALSASLLLWSGATFLQGFTGNFFSLFGLRLAVGVAEAPAAPSCNRIVSTWFPKKERGKATSGFVVGQYLGPALFSPILFWVAATFGWREIFYLTGGLGLILGLIVYKVYRDPKKDSRLYKGELDYITEGGALVDAGGAASFSWDKVGQLLRFRQIWALCIGVFSVNSTQYFFLTWFPTYLIKGRHVDLLHAGFMTALPYVAAGMGVLVSGWWADHLLHKGASLSKARKLPIIIGFVLVGTIVTANLTASIPLMISIITFAYFAQGMSSTSWSIISEVAPTTLMGTAGGFINFVGNLSGIVTPIVVGFIVAQTGSFVWALGFVGIVAAIGACSYIFLLGPIRRIELAQ